MTTPNERGKRTEAIELLTHYFELCSRGEWKFDSDNAAEIETIIDDIITVAVSRAVTEILKTKSTPDAGSWGEYQHTRAQQHN